MVKSLAAMRETWVWSLGREDPLEKGMAIHSSILAWRISYTEEPGGLQSMGSQRLKHNRMTNTRAAFWERKSALHEIVSQIGFHVDFCSHPQSNHYHYCCGKEETPGPVKEICPRWPGWWVVSLGPAHGISGCQMGALSSAPALTAPSPHWTRGAGERAKEGPDLSAGLPVHFCSRHFIDGKEAWREERMRRATINL